MLKLKIDKKGWNNVLGEINNRNKKVKEIKNLNKKY